MGLSDNCIITFWKNCFYLFCFKITINVNFYNNIPGLYMHTRSWYSENMATIDEMKEYFSELISEITKPLATINHINKLFEDFKSEMIEKYEKKIDDQNRKIEILESSLAARQNVVDKLLLNCDNNEQYSRRSCLRIIGVEYDENSNDDVIEKIKTCYNEIGLDFNKDIIDRAHRVGKSYVDKTGKSTKQIIVKYKFWNDRYKFYKARPRNYGKQNPSSFSLAVDLTKRRYGLLRSTIELIKDHQKIKYTFADVNCSLGLRLHDDSLCFFNSESELDGILNKL